MPQHRNDHNVLDGTLDVAVAEGSEVPTFTNQYTAEGDVLVEGEKTLDGRPLADSDPWTFAVAKHSENPSAPLDLRHASDAAEKIEDGKADITKTSSKWTYGFLLHYTLEDLWNERTNSYDKSKNFKYTITEAGEADGVTNDAKPVRTILVTVTDPCDSSGELEVSYHAVTDNLNYVNTYAATGSIDLTGTKTIDTRNIKTGDSFSFEVVELNADGSRTTVQSPQVTATTDAKSIAIPYLPITYAYDVQKGVDDRGKHTYEVKETATNAEGVTMTETTHTLVVDVSDDGKGSLTATASKGDPKALDFQNAYTSTCAVELKVTKSFGELSWPFGLTFDFELSANKGTPMPESTIVEGMGAEEKTKSFGTITFSIDDLKQVSATTGRAYGDFTYVIHETVPDDPLDITYDTKDHTVVVHVEEAGDGTLATSFDFAGDAAWTHDGGTATVTITNRFRPSRVAQASLCCLNACLSVATRTRSSRRLRRKVSRLTARRAPSRLTNSEP